MKGDFSRDTFDRTKHFSRVLMQQGRVQLDADWNEQAAILLHYLRTLAADLIGPFAGPAGDSNGFRIGDADISSKDFSIGKGRYYVDGILCENDMENTRYNNQQNYPNPPQMELDTRKNYLVYLDVWEHHITALEDDYIREKALGGLDTASRAKVVWQVKLWDTAIIGTPSLDGDTDKAKQIRDNWQEWIQQESWQPRYLGCLKAQVKQPADSKDPCLTAPEAKYRGTENQLYRVEIHTGGEVGVDKVTFKWSRDNGATVTGCHASGMELTVHNPRGFAANQWVELTNEGQELRGKPGVLVKVTKVDAVILTLEKSVSKPADVPDTEDWPTRVRRWDQSEKGGTTLAEDRAVMVQESTKDSDWTDLEDGIQIQFVPNKKERNRYRTGDYWLIPARVATGNIEWPLKLRESGEPERDADGNTIPLSRPPHGIHHHYAPLAILTFLGNTWNVNDCRCVFPTANKCGLPSYGEEGMGGASACASESADTRNKLAYLPKKVPSPPKKSKPK